MKIFCKKNLNRLWSSLMVALASVFYWSCAEEGESTPKLIPDNGLPFFVFPNDQASSDSASSTLSHGLVLEVHPNAIYTLSFEADTVAGAPKLLLYSMNPQQDGLTYTLHQVRNLKPVLDNGRYVYEFLCEERFETQWAAVLEKNGTYYQGTTNDVRFTGEGAYSDHLSLNLVVVGNVGSKLDGFTIDDLSQAILQGFRKYYTSIVVDTLYVSYAHEHPRNGSLYPANEPWIAGRSDDDIMMSNLGGGWPGRENALDLVLVHYLDEVGLLGYSYLFSGNMGGGPASTVVLGAFLKTPAAQEAISMENIVATAVHESGHFFGLRHTTATMADLSALGDYSMVEDGMTDTPYCPELLGSGLMKRSPSSGSDFMIRKRFWNRLIPMGKGRFSAQDCPDASNIMFPAETGLEYDGFSAQQLELVRKNLMIYPH